MFAHWFSGTLRIPEGKQLNYVHTGYASTYERDRLLKFENGVMVESSVRSNGAADNSDSPEGYGIGAMTIFPPRGHEKDAAQ